jgi:hypothetical protein
MIQRALRPFAAGGAAAGPVPFQDEASIEAPVDEPADGSADGAAAL